MLDRIDKDIIRLLIKYQKKYLTTNQIAIKTKISPLTAKRHLEKLENDGYVEFQKSVIIREYDKKWHKKKK